ncbi:hypothetical protein [Sorangium sp. So ce542]|uniref:hypothetical protein n=1 Tax=Sorangium sp. So ce542 TaxID=3133316 RepID=UPI003F62BF4B
MKTTTASVALIAIIIIADTAIAQQSTTKIRLDPVIIVKHPEPIKIGSCLREERINGDTIKLTPTAANCSLPIEEDTITFPQTSTQYLHSIFETSALGTVIRLTPPTETPQKIKLISAFVTKKKTHRIVDPAKLFQACNGINDKDRLLIVTTALVGSANIYQLQGRQTSDPGSLEQIGQRPTRPTDVLPLLPQGRTIVLQYTSLAEICRESEAAAVRAQQEKIEHLNTAIADKNKEISDFRVLLSEKERDFEKKKVELSQENQKKLQELTDGYNKQITALNEKIDLLLKKIDEIIGAKSISTGSPSN